MLRIGLTGGIGSGKSTVANYFKELGIDIIDADEVARAVVAPGQPALTHISNYFGSDVLTADGSLNRNKLREIIFTHPTKRHWLEKLLHPLIRKKMLTLAEQATSPYCILAIPLLIENQLKQMVHRILVVDSSEELQISRTQQRDQLSAEQIMRIMATQVSREQRLAAADDVIINDSDLTKIKAQVLALHQHYLTYAHSPFY